MAYDIAQDPYVDEATGILRNKLGAATQSQLDKAESEITYIAILTLTTGSKPDTLTFDEALLTDIHKEIFHDIYNWAGEIRTHDISKEWSYFCHARYITPQLVEVLNDVGGNPSLVSADFEVFVGALTHYYAELNAIHPFREGNGRAIRTFLRLLALKYGHDIEWARMDGGENIEASKEALHAGNDRLFRMMKDLVVKL